MIATAVMQLTLPFTTIPTEPADPPIVLPPAVREPESDIVFVRTPRARRYILRVRPDGTLRVTLPRWGSKREAREFIARQRQWIARERERVFTQHGPHEWTDGREILLRGHPVRIGVEPGINGGLFIRYAHRRFWVPAGTSVRDAIEADLRTVAREELVPRLRELANEHDLRPGRVSIRNQRSRWGSCTRDGSIALNFRLVQMPEAIRDYVLVHELMHMRQQNHSRRFWRLVEEAYPHFREAERWLRVEGRGLF
jgi:predicted metal-dependent hydrolase